MFVLACVAGGAIGARIHPEASKGVMNFTLYIVVGFLFAIFSVPAFAEWAGIVGDRVLVGMGFFAAMFWMPIAAKVKGAIEGLRVLGLRGGKD